MKYDNFYDQVKELTIDLVKTPSIVRSKGEVVLGDKIISTLMELPYFKAHPEYIRKIPIPDDKWKRFSVLAWIDGLEKSEDAVILLSHYDTVPVEEFGHLKEFAFDPEVLTKHFQKENKTANDREWLYGRGILDMKSGVASNLAVLKTYAENRESLNGSLVFLACPDEEAIGIGAITASSSIRKLAKEKSFNYVGLINSDYTTARYPGDSSRYVYYGTIGKYLVSFFIKGIPSHVGEVFRGLDSNLISSELVRLIDLNTELCDELDGEFTPPPVSLKQKDLKPSYDVQNPFLSHLYFNVYSHGMTSDEIIEKMRQLASVAMNKVLMKVNREYRKYCEIKNVPYHSIDYKTNILTFEELVKMTGKPQVQKFQESQAITTFVQQDRDLPELSMEIVHQLWNQAEINDDEPSIVIYLAPPFFPRIYMDGQSEKQRCFMEAVEEAISEASVEFNEQIESRKFYPYISDMSWFGISEDEDSCASIRNNMAGWGSLFSIELGEMRQMDIPVVNIGPYGFDAHGQKERVETYYSFKVVPAMISKTISKLLSDKRSSQSKVELSVPLINFSS
ncbi:arginine utilization protein RocB [Neobacillus niacini]|uniref:M20/M25/M40 family metallo-hydrolase n=1 Tax=Neobacillus driksii TaxID=3035913 RepID=UPI002789E3A4|nr:M20/M25/M40 family metallo-hydrolase [Neobacillus niacini]MDQ0970305.1 arginine utilization protein RocB [Neobacillus niacini]